MRPAGALTVIALLACCGGAGALAAAGLRQELRLGARGGLPETWVSWAEPCATRSGPRMTMLGVGAGDGRLRWDVPGDAAATRALEDLEYDVQSEGDEVTLTSRNAFQGVRLVQRYVLSIDGDTLDATLQVPPGARLLLESGATFVLEPLAGLARMYDGVEAVRISRAGQETVAGATAVSGREWVGMRDRFWALVPRPAAGVTVDVSSAAPDRPRLGGSP